LSAWFLNVYWLAYALHSNSPLRLLFLLRIHLKPNSESESFTGSGLETNRTGTGIPATVTPRAKPEEVEKKDHSGNVLPMVRVISWLTARFPEP
jgi:hypothetical protein